jgi:serine/threonine protein kinase
MQMELVCPISSGNSISLHVAKLKLDAGIELVLVKTANVTSPSPGAADSIRNETAILLRLAGLRLVPRVHHFTQTEFQAHICTDLFTGGDLMTHLETRGTFGLEMCRGVVSDLLTALTNMHSRGIVHRDIQPDKIVFDKRTGWRLVSFGIAHRIGETRSSDFGCVDYMAPEILSGSSYSESVDYWSVGIILYEMIYGGPPFSDEDRDRNKTIYRILHGDKYLIFSDNSSSELSEANDMIRHLLSPIPSDRSLVLSHPFLRRHRFDSRETAKRLAKTFNFIDYLECMQSRFSSYS